MTATASATAARPLTASDLRPGASVEMWRGDVVQIIRRDEHGRVHYRRHGAEVWSPVHMFLSCAKAVVR